MAAGDPYRLDNQRILVTGASSGIGAATARLLARRGAQVLLNGRDEPRLNSVAQSLEGEQPQTFQADLSEPAARSELARAVGVLDGLVFSAGVAKPAPAKFWQAKDWEQTNAINHAAPLLFARELLKAKALADGASLVFVSSISAHRASVGYGLYAASKAALEAGVRVLALELAPRKIRANCLVPGLVETPMTDAQSAIPDASMQAYRARYPLGTGAPDDVALAAGFLLSPASKWTTGTSLLLDGGYSLT
ncbi:MAG: SDR family NAD(P)-dependent oxidoreductase [Opitutales bacterium]